MTKETKIGLLVGLAFIILFAIILSEKGAPPRDTKTPVFKVADGGRRDAVPDGTTVPLENEGKLRVDEQLNPLVQAPAPATMQSPTEESVVQATPTEETRLPALPESVLNTLNASPLASETSSTDGPPLDTAALVDASHGRDGGATLPSFGTASTTPPPSHGSGTTTDFGTNTAITPSPMNVTPPSNHATRTAEPAANASGGAHPPAAPAIKTTHTVGSGECIGKIAATYYGRSTPERIKAIYDANRDVLKDLNAVRQGDKLKIPDLPDAEKNFEPVPTVSAGTLTLPATTPRRDLAPRIPKPIEERLVLRTDPIPTPRSASSETRSAPPAPSNAAARVRWYEVRKGDTFSSIARRELGGEKNCRKIMEMNRDVVNKPQSLRAGMKIRLPQADETSMATSLSSVVPMNGEP